jgi:Zn-dependent peptidase ImmA (M78 family)
MSAAHELGHVLFGDVERGRPAARTKEKAIENRAYDFACFFLLPKVQLERAFQGRSMLRLLEFKERFGIALSAMVYRAEKESVINHRAAKWLWVQFSQRGWRTQEPGYVWRDRATRFERLLECAILEKRLTWRESELVSGIPESELLRRIAEALGGDLDEEEGTDNAQVLRIAR